MKNKRTTVFILFLFVCIITADAQPGAGGPGPPGLSLPIDGGLTMSIIAAVVFGVYKICNSKK